MESVSLPKAPRGTLEDPEVLQNVPGHVIPILQREFDDFKTEATKFLAGETPEDEFIKFRLKQGVYGQRQPDVQMIRVKLPFGGITPEQMEKFADVVEKYVPLNKGHITTRQNIQMHHIPLPEAEKAIRELGEAGLSSREGCGNTVRNVTGDPWAGVAADELFDLTPYAGAYVRYFVRHPTTQAMPRKIKTSFDGAPRDRAISGIHDIAFRARVKEIEGRGDGARRARCWSAAAPRSCRGWRRRCTSSCELDNGDYLKIAEAVFRIFDRQEWLRVNRARARIKVFVDKFGIDELRRQVEEELKGDWVAERDFSIEQPPVPRRRARGAPRRRPRATAAPTATSREFERFRAANVRAQKQEGFVTVEVEGRPRRPDARAVPRPGRRSCASTPAATRGRRCSRTSCCAGCARRACTTSGARSRELGLGDAGSREINDVVSCPGTDSLQARDHELDGPQPGGRRSASKRWGSPTR